MKKKILVAVLVATATLAFAGFGTGCKIKDKIDEWMCNHVYNDGEVTLAPTCSETGEIKYTCLDCGKTYTEEIEKLPHTYDIGMITTEPTCTEMGVRTQLCVDCGAEKTSVVAKTEHMPVTVSLVAPTCETVGYTEWQYCGDCNVILIPKKEIPSLGHVEVLDNAVAATCTTTGKTAGSHCGTCGEVFVAQTTVQALGHTVVAVDGNSPTCTETGLTAGSKCSVCNTILVEQTVISATGIHVDDNLDSYCDICCDIDFSYYQDAANYMESSYYPVTGLDGKVARLHVATTADDGTVTDNNFACPNDGFIYLSYDRSSDSFGYRWVSNTLPVEGNGLISHDDIQYYAFEVDGEYYVDVYFTNDVVLTLMKGLDSESGDPSDYDVVYEDFKWGAFRFDENTNVEILQRLHVCLDLNADGVCDKCDLLPTSLSGKTYRMDNLTGVDMDMDESNGYEIFRGPIFELYDATNSSYSIVIAPHLYSNTCNIFLKFFSDSFTEDDYRYGENQNLIRYSGDAITITQVVNSSRTEAYYDFYFKPNANIVFNDLNNGISVTFNIDNLRIKSGELVFVE